MRCKAIRARILGEGDGWLCLGEVWWVGGGPLHTPPNHTQPNQTPIRARASPETNQRAMRRMVTVVVSLPASALAPVLSLSLAAAPGPSSDPSSALTLTRAQSQ